MYSKKVFTWMAGLVILGVCSNSAFAEAKIGVVNVQKAIFDSEGAQVIMQQIKDDLKDEESRIRDLEKELTGMAERLRKDSEVMSDAQKRKLQQEIETKRGDYQHEAQKYQRSVELKQQELFAGIDVKVQKAIEELVKSDDFDLIFHRQQMVYVGDVYDITRKVTEKLNGMK